MTYKGISKEEHPNSPIWGYMALFESITDDWDDDMPLQRMVDRHYLEIKIYKLLFNLVPYMFLIYLIKG